MILPAQCVMGEEFYAHRTWRCSCKACGHIFWVATTADNDRVYCADQQIRRLSKASKCAQQLSELASARGNARTALEAQAYALWMAGTLAFERQQWQPALAKLLRAQ